LATGGRIVFIVSVVFFFFQKKKQKSVVLLRRRLAGPISSAKLTLGMYVSPVIFALISYILRNKVAVNPDYCMDFTVKKGGYF
jgi:hypothetical protein